MDASEREILDFLQTRGSEFVSAKEICRKASSKKRFHAEPHWAIPILQLMTERGVLERDNMGRYHLKPNPKKKTVRRWVSPAIAGLFKETVFVIDEDTTEIGPKDKDPGQA